MTRHLLLGAGNRRIKWLPGPDPGAWQNLVTIDVDANANPTLVRDLATADPLPFPDDYFDEVHAYEVLEHLGAQGDYRLLFAQFSEYWRLLRPDGLLCASVPRWDSIWAWGDPSHTRIISEATLTFLSQPEYTRQVGVTPMSDYRSVYRADFDALQVGREEHTLFFVLRAVKPARL